MGYRLRPNPRILRFALTPVSLHGGDKPATDVAEKRANQSGPLNKNADGRLTSAWHESPYGKITSAREMKGNSIRWNVTVPWNTAATVKLPGLTKITLNGKPQDKGEFDLPAGKWDLELK